MLTIGVKVNLLLLSLYKMCPVNEHITTTHKQQWLPKMWQHVSDPAKMCMKWQVNNHDITVKTSMAMHCTTVVSYAHSPPGWTVKIFVDLVRTPCSSLISNVVTIPIVLQI